MNGNQTYRTRAILTLANICVTAGDPRATKAVRTACKEVGSVSDIIFEMRFNVNIFSPGTVKNSACAHTHTHACLSVYLSIYLLFVFCVQEYPSLLVKVSQHNCRRDY